MTKNVGLDRPCCVATIEASRAAEGRAYVAFDGHRSDDDDPLVFVTEDFGQTWASLKANLPRGSTRCLREDLVNPDLLYLGTEFAVWASLDRGKFVDRRSTPTCRRWRSTSSPSTRRPARSSRRRTAGASGCSTSRACGSSRRDALKAKAALLKPQAGRPLAPRAEPGRDQPPVRRQEPPARAQIDVALTAKAEKATLKVLDFDGATVYETRVPTEPGLHRLTWSLTRPAPRPADAPAAAGRGRVRRPASAARSAAASRPFPPRPARTRSSSASTARSRRSP